MATGKCLAFYEGNFLVKTLSTDDEREQAYRLRHKVFAERLKWVKESPDELEIDAYDRLATNLGLFTESGKLCGISRLLRGGIGSAARASSGDPRLTGDRPPYRPSHTETWPRG